MKLASRAAIAATTLAAAFCLTVPASAQNRI